MSINAVDQAHQTETFNLWSHFQDTVPTIGELRSMRINQPQMFDYLTQHVCPSVLDGYAEIDLTQVTATLPSQVRRVAPQAGELALAG